MLIQKKSVAVGDVAAFRLVNGDELVAKVVAISDAGITVTKPVVIQVQIVGPNQAALAFAPYMASADEDANFEFARETLLSAPLLARKDIKDNYIQKTSNIVPAANLPGNGLLPGLGG